MSKLKEIHVDIDEKLSPKKIKEILEQNKEQLKQDTKSFRLYDKILSFDIDNKFSNEFIKLAYECLKSWGMENRGAKLFDFEEFKQSILNNKSNFSNLQDVQLKEINNENFGTLFNLFKNLKISQTSAKLVGFSKLVHFYLPNLISPIDRKYTLAFFYPGNSSYFPSGKEENQFIVFKNIHEIYKKFSMQNDFEQYVSSTGWNRNIPKIIDNLILGYLLIDNCRRT